LMEWLGSEPPQPPRPPYRLRYHVILSPELVQGTRERLANLGFGDASTDEQNVSDFELAYSLPVTGVIHNVSGVVRDYHDTGFSRHFPKRQSVPPHPHLRASPTSRSTPAHPCLAGARPKLLMSR
ncbi:MAG: hypothetical protein RIF41_34165, partial [Polyangiaceae bacterium]